MHLGTPTSDRTQPRRRWQRLAAALAVTALPLAACGSEEPGEPGGGNGAGAPADDDVENVDSDAPAQDEAAADEADDAGQAEAPVDAASAMTGEDGWVPLHDLALPDPGTARLEVEGESYTIDIRCTGPGEVPEDALSAYLFTTMVLGDFTMADGRDAMLTVKRQVHMFEDWQATGGAGDVYDYPGQDYAEVLLAVEDSGSWHSSGLSSPSDSDPTGSLMPLVHVSPDGGFTAEGELEQLWSHDAAVTGAFTLAGQCSAPWADMD